MWTYRAALIEAHDADTLRLEVDLGFHVATVQDIRLFAVSAPELNQPGGQEATEWVRDWLASVHDLRWPLQVTTLVNHNIEPEEKRTFTRYLGTVTDIADGRVLNNDLRGYLAEHPEWGSGI